MAAPILVHGATGFTGRLVCAALARRGLEFAIGGRDKSKLEALAGEVGVSEVAVIDITSGGSLRSALVKRQIVCACAGPFVRVGEPVLATCARLGVHYVDTTGEQAFVADAVMRYRATAEASGACVVPAMAYEIAPADWAAHLAAEKVGGAPDALDILYVTRMDDGYGAATTRGTKLSALGMAVEPDPRQFVGGTLVHEPAAEIVETFRLREGKSIVGVSFPSPEAVVVPTHTHARSVRTFMAMGSLRARAIHRLRRAIPPVVRAVRPILERRIAAGKQGPNADARDATFEIVAQARREGAEARVFVTGRDPYGLTAEIQAWAAERAMRGEVRARGVLAPSVGYPPGDAFTAMRRYGVSVTASV